MKYLQGEVLGGPGYFWKNKWWGVILWILK